MSPGVGWAIQAGVIFNDPGPRHGLTMPHTALNKRYSMRLDWPSPVIHIQQTPGKHLKIKLPNVSGGSNRGRNVRTLALHQCSGDAGLIQR